MPLGLLNNPKLYRKTRDGMASSTISCRLFAHRRFHFALSEPGTSMNCLFDAILQDTAPKEKARRRITAAGLQAPAKSGSHWVTPQPSSYSVFVPFQLD